MNKRIVHISVVSHHQENFIITNFENFDFEDENYHINLTLIDNTNSKKLEDFAISHNHKYFADNEVRGYGENHNKGFEISKVEDNDIFIVCNPDVILEKEQLIGMLDNFISNNHELGNVKSFYNKEKTIVEVADRYFPCFLNFVFSILLKKRFHYGTNINITNPEWISGGFMITRGDIYKKLNGFDEEYFMYVEDIDLCRRAKELGIKITHDKNHYIIHETQMDSRQVLSNSFKMHISSVLRYLLKHKVLCILKVAR